MQTPRFRLALILLALGTAGILSLLTTDIPLSPETEALLRERFSPFQIKLLLTINPFLFLLTGVTAGILLYRRVGYSLPLLEKLAGAKFIAFSPGSVVKAGITGGIGAALILRAIDFLWTSRIPSELLQASNPNMAVRLLYGGFTEEITVRFGWMTFITWLIYKLTGKLNAFTYWAAIITTAILFGAAHLPAAVQLTGGLRPEITAYVVGANAAAGIIFGYLYWRHGLEAAILAHMTAHILLFITEYF